MQVEGQHWYLYQMATGARVRNAYATYLLQGDSPGKLGLIPHKTPVLPDTGVKASAVADGHAYD